MSATGTPAPDTTVTTTAVPPVPGSDASTPWYQGIDGENLGYIQNRGLDKLDAKAAVLSTIKAHREAEKLLGVPVDQLVRFPKDATDSEGWNKVYSKLGVPADAKEYSFADVKFTDGTELNEDVAGGIRAIAAEGKLTKDQAVSVARGVVKLLDAAEAAEGAELAAKVAIEKDTLSKNWGANANANMIVAQNAARALGVTEEEVKALESVVGYARVMELFRAVGGRIGEDQFIRSQAPGGTGPMSREQAQATLASRQMDTEWRGKLLSGDPTVRREFDNLTRLLTGR
jgi:hypothetical protein